MIQGGQRREIREWRWWAPGHCRSLLWWGGWGRRPGQRRGWRVGGRRGEKDIACENIYTIHIRSGEWPIMCTVIRDTWHLMTWSLTRFMMRTSLLPASGILTGRGHFLETWSMTSDQLSILSTTTASRSITRGTVCFIFTSHFHQHWSILMKWIDEHWMSLMGNEMDIVLKLRTPCEYERKLWQHARHPGEWYAALNMV